MFLFFSACSATKEFHSSAVTDFSEHVLLYSISTSCHSLPTKNLHSFLHCTRLYSSRVGRMGCTAKKRKINAIGVKMFFVGGILCPPPIVDAKKKKKPNHIYHMPVPRCTFQSKMVLLCKMSAPQAYATHA